MLPRQPPIPVRCSRPFVPRCWLMTDRRLGPSMLAIVAAMPPRSGVVIRPYAMEPEGRAAMIRAIRRIGRAKRHLLLIADRAVAGFDGRHGGGPAQAKLLASKPGSITSMPVHNQREAAAARRAGARICLISPVWPTRSHSGAPCLGHHGFARLARQVGANTYAIAMGGIDAAAFRRLKSHGADGWAAIDAWQRDSRPRTER